MKPQQTTRYPLVAHLALAGITACSHSSTEEVGPEMGASADAESIFDGSAARDASSIGCVDLGVLERAQPPRYPDSASAWCIDPITQFRSPCPQPGAPGYGQDGCVTGPINDLFRSGGDETTVTDRVTGLMWQVASQWPLVPFEAAVEKCRTLSWAGACDWRLPGALELASILDHGQSRPARSRALGGLPDNAWTTDMVAVPGGNPAVQHVIVDFTIGGVGPRDLSYAMGPAICVRGAPLVSACRPGNGVIADDNSGLEWEAGVSTKAVDWSGALDHCNRLVAGGHDDWRLASTKELVSLFVNPCAPAVALATTSYWSSTPFAREPGEGSAMVWSLDARRRNLGLDDPTFALDVLCVRGGL